MLAGACPPDRQCWMFMTALVLPQPLQWAGREGTLLRQTQPPLISVSHWH
jgi:hypothetical protein